MKKLKRESVFSILLFLGIAYAVGYTFSIFHSPDTRAACQLIEQGYGPSGTSPLAYDEVASGLETPWGLGFLPDGDFLVNERPGRIRIVRNGILAPKPVAQVSTSEPGEGGLLGIAIDPKFSENRFFYVYYTTAKSGKNVNRVERFKLNIEKTQASLDGIVIDDIPAAVNHNGGRIKFGPSGFLYIGTGDASDPPLAQDQNSLAGKILRITSQGQIPSDNPWPGNPAYIIGIRNTQGFDWIDDQTMIIADHGPTGELGRRGHDEVSIGHKGENLGWPNVWQCEESAGYVTPLIVWNDALPPGGAAFIKTPNPLNWAGSLVLGSLGAKLLNRVILSQTPAEVAQIQGTEVYFQGNPPQGLGRLREVIQAPSGDIYVTTSNCDGRGTCPEKGDIILKLKL